jgi:hypothetical protein
MATYLYDINFVFFSSFLILHVVTIIKVIKLFCKYTVFYVIVVSSNL